MSKVDTIRELARKLAGGKAEKPKVPPKPPPKTPQPPPGKKRGQYRRIECPYCHSFVGNLGNHIRLKHSTEAEQGLPIPPKELTKENLLGEKPKPPEKVTYYCTNCHAELRKGENPCWNCGTNLVWEGIE